MYLDDFASMMASQLHRAAVPLQRQLDTLKRLNLTVSPAQEEALQADPGPYEREPYTAILTYLAREGSPQVLAVDSEAAEAGTMYRDLLSRLQALTGGEVVLADAAALGNWLDLDLFAFLNQALEAGDFRKRFVTVDDARVQGLLVFYRTPEWARFFAAGTGLTVKDT
ncbi:hypothetical protein [uncultured Intestinimonas sp.]|uniref:hypothetical protein n=1 Tax=uncultured Intestinimonas sp. TaxID=1689265 RepID=UPI0025F227EB|nr:hypothetical protein [uncultured Intestinimonas sp.]